jgi:hypothetical protein
MSLICTPTALCDAHRDGASKRAKCPGYCDARGCRERATTEVGPRGRTLCDAHAKPRPVGRPRTTGRDSTPVVAFRLGADEHARAAVVAKRGRTTVNELAKRALLATLA